MFGIKRESYFCFFNERLMKKYLIKVSVFMVLLASSSAGAWGLTGHRIVAEIAERNISSKTKKDLQKIIGPQKLAYWTNWPDFIKSDKSWDHAGSYHYVNIPGELSYPDFIKALENTSEENLYKKGQFFIHALKHDKQMTAEQRQRYLYFIIHIIGDAHQPLHIGREEDLGGNKISVQWFKNKTNIHSVWDSKLIDYEKYSYTEYTEVLNVLSKEEKQQLMQGTFSDWLYDSYQQANYIYARIKIDDQLGYRYHFENKYIVERQLTKGGLRLAKVLNDIFE